MLRRSVESHAQAMPRAEKSLKLFCNIFDENQNADSFSGVAGLCQVFR
jgi:hypothetical protein